MIDRSIDSLIIIIIIIIIENFYSALKNVNPQRRFT